MELIIASPLGLLYKGLEQCQAHSGYPGLAVPCEGKDLDQVVGAHRASHASSSLA